MNQIFQWIKNMQRNKCSLIPKRMTPLIQLFVVNQSHTLQPS